MKSREKKPSTKKSNRAWIARMKKKGRCLQCGQKKNGSPYRGSCEPCAKERRERQRRLRGGGSWKPGGPGRPPKVK